MLECVPGCGSKSKSFWSAVAVLGLGLAIRLAFHPAAIDPMHRVVVGPGVAILDGSFIPDHFADFRYGLIYPTALFFAMFGVNLVGLNAYPLLCSMGSVILAFAIGKRIGNCGTGLAAGLVLAVLPLDIYLAGRGDWPDGPQAFFACLAIWLLLVSEDQQDQRRALLAGFGAGLAFGFSCWVKVTTVYLIPAIALYAVFQRKARIPLLAAAAALAFAFVGEMALDYGLTGNPLARVHSITNVAEGNGGGTSQTVGYSVSQLHAYPKKFFLQPLMYGVHMYFAVGALVFIALRRPPRTLLLTLCVVWFFGYVWLGSASPTRYLRLSQFARYLAIINVPLAVLIGLWLCQLRPWLRGSSFALLAAAGLFMANVNVTDLGERTSAIRTAAAYLADQPEKIPVYANLHTDSALSFFLGQDSDREIITYGRTAHGKDGIVEGLASVEDAYIVFDRNQIEELLRRYPDQKYPEEVFSPPDHWQEVLVVDNPGRASSYAQLRLLKWFAEKAPVPDAISQKVIATIKKVLDKRDLVVYFAPDRKDN